MGQWPQDGHVGSGVLNGPRGWYICLVSWCIVGGRGAEVEENSVKTGGSIPRGYQTLQGADGGPVIGGLHGHQAVWLSRLECYRPSPPPLKPHVIGLSGWFVTFGPIMRPIGCQNGRDLTLTSIKGPIMMPFRIILATLTVA